MLYSYGRDRAVDISGIATSGNLTVTGVASEDIFVTNGTGS